MTVYGDEMRFRLYCRSLGLPETTSEAGCDPRGISDDEEARQGSKPRIALSLTGKGKEKKMKKIFFFIGAILLLLGVATSTGGAQALCRDNTTQVSLWSRGMAFVGTPYGLEVQVCNPNAGDELVVTLEGSGEFQVPEGCSRTQLAPAQPADGFSCPIRLEDIEAGTWTRDFGFVTSQEGTVVVRAQVGEVEDQTTISVVEPAARIFLPLALNGGVIPPPPTGPSD